MARRVDIRLACLVGGEAQRMPDRTGRDLVVADEAGQDRQARGVGTRPAGRAKRVRAQVPGRAAAGVPGAVEAVGGEELEEPAAVLVDHEDVAVAAGTGPFDEGRRRDRVPDVVGLVVVFERTVERGVEAETTWYGIP